VAYEVRGLGSETIGDWMARTAIESFVTVPTMLRHLLNTLGTGVTLPHLRLVMLYGETTTWEDLDSLFGVAPDATVIVMFGSTESGFFASSVLTAPMPRASGPIPIGTPITGYDVQIEDDLGQPVPDGEIGELVVVSPEPSLGYWHRPELDQAVFEARADDRVHIRTGDRARRLPDGSTEHLGRKDHLVKVAGNRVELGEVEAALLGLPGVADAVAAPYQDHAGASRLTAAVVPRPGAEATLSSRSLRAEIARRLPAAMVPDEVAVLSELPRLANGKVDRRSLAASRTELHTHSTTAGSSPAPAAAGPHAESLRAIWCTVLERSDVGLDDDFFDLGGDSLRAIELFVEIERQMGIRAVPTLLLEAPKLSDLAQALARQPGTGTFTIPIQPGTSGALPLFVVNAGTSGLSVARLSELLGPERPIYEVWAGADETRFEDVAARCVAELGAAVPSGPFALYGFSLSGVLAFEMGLQLQAAGRRPSLLVLGDSPSPGESPLPAMAYGMWRRTVEDPRPRTLLRRVLGKVRDDGPQNRPQDGPQDPGESRAEPATSPFLREWHQHLVLASAYRPGGRLDCATVLHRSSDSPIGKRGWSRHVARRVQVRDIPGPHAHQVKAGVPDVARSLAADLARIDALGAPPFAAPRLGR
jgi:thioesterase domain-containing protein/acyl carrier protein